MTHQDDGLVSGHSGIETTLRKLAERIAANARELIEHCEPSGLPHWQPVPITVDDYGTVTIGVWGGYWLQICRMMFNERIVLTPAHMLGYSYDHGWCYPPGTAIAALLAWNPETQGEPPGYLKRATPGLRQPGERAAHMQRVTP